MGPHHQIQIPTDVDDNDSSDSSDSSGGGGGGGGHGSYPNYIDRFEDWEDDTRHLHTTIQTILDIPVGETRQFLCLDRHAVELASNSMSEYNSGEIVNPDALFTNNYYISFTKTGPGITGNYFIIHSAIELVNLSTDLQTDNPRNPCTDFDIEYADHRWYPMNNGILPASDEQGMVHLLGAPTEWTAFPTKTRLGWRGPMIPLENLNDVPFRF